MSRLDDTRHRELIRTLAVYYVDQDDQLAHVVRGERAPELPTVYLLCAESKVVYVGQTHNLRIRLAQHEGNSRVRNTGWDRTFYFRPGIVSRHKRLVVETCLIVTMLPPANQAVLLRKNRFGNLCPVRFSKTLRRKAEGD